MSWNRLPQDVQQAAADALTDLQLATFKLELSGLGLRRIARHFQIAPTTAKDRLTRAHEHLIAAGIHQNAQGQWLLDKEAQA